MANVSVISRELREVLNPNQFRQLVQELISFDTGSETAPEAKRVNTSTGQCRCPCVCSWMNPDLWSTLPEDLLQLVFARLPLPKISQLRILSKQWNYRFTSNQDTEFMQTCARANPKMFAMIAQGHAPEHISVRSLDIKAKKWYSLHQPVAEGSNVVTMCAGDGGLVCMVSVDENPLIITVFNPLTRQQRRLLSPKKLLMPMMVQMVMDEETKFYKVLVVGEKKLSRGRHGTRVVAEIYSSDTGLWRSVKDNSSDHLTLGYLYRWDKPADGVLEDTILGPSAYDFTALNHLVDFDFQMTPVRRFRGAPFESYALLGDRLFLLDRKLVARRIVFVVVEFQYQGGDRDPSLVEVRIHDCGEFELPPHSVRYRMQLYACREFLLMQASNTEGPVYGQDLAWLYDLDTAVWQKVPAIPYPSGHDEFMFELRWDAVP